MDRSPAGPHRADPTPPRVGFARWRSDLASGGNRYDEELTVGLQNLGLDVHEYAISGSWPTPSDDERRRLAALLDREDEWLVGNIVASAVPDLLAAHTAAGRRCTVLLHYFPADDPSLPAGDRRRLAGAEAATVHAATRILVTSAWAAGQVRSRYGRTDAVVALPGTGPAPVAAGTAERGGPPSLLWLARLTEGKDPLTLIEALARLGDLDWTARLVGPLAVDATLTRRVRARIRAAGLSDRVELPGELHGAELEAHWASTDLLVHTSRAETYGMVVAEALARGIPSIVTAGTGAVETQGAGDTFPPGDAGALADVLRPWLTDGGRRERWRHDAVRQRAGLATWQDTARTVAAALTSATAPGPPRPAPGAPRSPRGRTPPAPSA